MRKYIIPLIPVTLMALYLAVPSLYSDEKGKLEFSHKLHVVEQEMECATCHAGAQSSQTGKDDLFPGKTVCNDCHEADEVGNPELLPRIQTYSEKFSHQLHLASGLECASCHAKLLTVEEYRGYILPTMAECMSCHETKAVTNECASCHLPSEDLKPLSHTPNFKHNHGDLARGNAKEISASMSCTTCHTQRFCQDCHEGDNLDRLTHPLNYEFTHALEAQSREKECAVCHTERQFCYDCHSARQVLPYNHKPGWANNLDGGRHRVEALNDLESCLGCHEQNARQICQPCHPAN